MAKIESAGRTQKISLSQIIETGNVREDYRDIEELAQSIKDNGLMQPIVVKRAGLTSEGIPQFELVAGNRRKRALEFLCSKGDDFSMVDAVIITGDKLTLQLIENIQRSDLTSAERENGVFEMLNTGLSQREIAAKLAKSEQWVSRHLAAHKTRQILTSKGINCEYETNILTAFRTIPDDDLIPLVEKLEELGGTKAAAEKITREYKNPSLADTGVSENQSENFKNEEPQPLKEESAIKEEMQTQPMQEPLTSQSEIHDENSVIAQTSTEQEHTYFEKNIKPENPLKGKTIYGEEIEPEDKLISSKFVFNQITDYIQAVKNKIGTLQNETLKISEQAKIEAAYDIIALLHTRD
ncbi:ParB N-terminal domain-containing protein [Treponema sp. OMZ 788]|uniref:ParB/RepB/Spo0J family partition protein n=1 Tax=Treponema sp. OMZ 788 TaxID=2563664 RepID=UPI0020A4F49D|nr:ParB/RepB/Spo0J family partition protein [Treponema sp. OMZ 788]UTC65207.1 ParB N-terminal domain-containing protein [Treponema sp. OMZ 788]